MKRYFLILFSIFYIILISLSCRGKEFKWPNDTLAAVCLTYDDGIDVHLDNAVPDLDAVKLKGTFFIPGNATSFYNRMEEWRAAAANGHEIGNHTLFHPCLKIPEYTNEREWLENPDRMLENYTVPRIVDELKLANTLLYAVDGKKERTYAYTCYDTVAGGKTYINDIRPLVLAGRIGGDRIVPDMKSLDLHKIPSLVSGEETTADNLISVIEKAADAGTMAVITFHGVGGAYINTNRDVHHELLAYLDSNRKRLWIATFLEIVKHIKTERKRVGWNK